jgi:hypothetical protein
LSTRPENHRVRVFTAKIFGQKPLAGQRFLTEIAAGLLIGKDGARDRKVTQHPPV